MESDLVPSERLVENHLSNRAILWKRVCKPSPVSAKDFLYDIFGAKHNNLKNQHILLRKPLLFQVRHTSELHHGGRPTNQHTRFFSALGEMVGNHFLVDKARGIFPLSRRAIDCVPHFELSRVFFFKVVKLFSQQNILLG